MFKPSKPKEPKAPQKKIDQLVINKSLENCRYKTLEDIVQQLNITSFDELQYVMFDIDRGYDSCDDNIECTYQKSEIVDNPHYGSEYAKYLDDRVEYGIALKKYEQDLKEYDANEVNRLQREIEERQQQIKALTNDS